MYSACYPTIYLSICLSFYLSIYHPSIYLFFTSIYPSIYLSQASQASVELERLRQERANDAQHAQQLLTEAKEETARA